MSSFSSLKRLFSSDASVFKSFAEHYDLVYFGKIHQEDEEQRVVKGITVSTQHYDQHYCVGTVQGYDMVLVKRTDTIAEANSSRTEKYSWIIMQFDLHSRYDNPHVFIDGGHHNELFYQSLFIKFARLMKVDKSLFGDKGQPFTSKFTTYTPPDALDFIPEVITDEIGATMASHFAHLDFEWYQDRLLVYSTGRMPTKHLIEHMLRAGLWLSEVLDKNGSKKIAAHMGAAVPNRSDQF
jgi:hypothetical protein